MPQDTAQSHTQTLLGMRGRRLVGENDLHFGASSGAGLVTQLGMGRGSFRESEVNPQVGLRAEKEEGSSLSKENKIGWLFITQGVN